MPFLLWLDLCVFLSFCFHFFFCSAWIEFDIDVFSHTYLVYKYLISEHHNLLRGGCANETRKCIRMLWRIARTVPRLPLENWVPRTLFSFHVEHLSATSRSHQEHQHDRFPLRLFYSTPILIIIISYAYRAIGCAVASSHLSCHLTCSTLYCCATTAKHRHAIYELMRQ